MTRDEYLRKLREEFIDRHLALPEWVERLPLWLQEHFRILYWSFFKPSALRLYVTRLVPEAIDEYGRLLVKRNGENDFVKSLTDRIYFIPLICSSLIAFAFGLVYSSLLGFPLSIGIGGAILGILLGWIWGVWWGVFRVNGQRAYKPPVVVVGGLTGGLLGGICGVLLGGAGEISRVSLLLMGTAAGFTWGTVFAVDAGIGAGVVWGIIIGFIGGVVLSFAQGIGSGAALGFALLGGAVIGATRLPFWLIYRVLSLFYPVSSILWDELTVLPEPGLSQWLAGKMRRSPAEAAYWLSFVARHPHARRAVFQAFSTEKRTLRFSLTRLLALLLRNPLPYIEPLYSIDADERRREADPYFSTKLVLSTLGNVGLSRQSGTSAHERALPPSLSAEEIHFFRAWYNFLEAAAPIDPAQFQANRLEETLAEVISASFKLAEKELQDLLVPILDLWRSSQSGEIGPVPLPSEAPNFSEVLNGLRTLNEAARAFEAYRAASSERARRDLLNEAFSALDRARRMAAESLYISQPFAAVLLLIAERWYQIVAEERDRLLASRPVTPLEDRYVVGPPLAPESGRLFVGREEIFRRLEELFQNPYQKVPVVLYGQRRMGKTSILKHVGVRLGPQYIPVLADLQGLLSDPQHPIQSDRDLWYSLMREIGQAVGVSPQPEEAPEDFLERMAPARGERFIVLMLDEFEKLEQRMDEGAVSRDFLEHLRYLMQHRRELLVLLSGHHTLRERMGRYWEPLMGIARSVRVSYLEEDAARRLITDPWDGFRLQYTEESIQRLLTATGRQPMLLQLAGSAVIREVNARMRREGYEVYPTARPEEVERALNRLLEEGETWYFDAVWDWLSEGQREIVMRLAQVYRPGSEGWIPWREVTGVGEEVIRSLEQREVLEVDWDSSRCRFRVELLRRWLAGRPRLPS